MGRKTIFVDDLDGTELRPEQAETFKFAVGSERYELDVSTANAEKLRSEFGKYIDVARNVTRLGDGVHARRSTSPRRASGDRSESQAIREWAVSKGLMDAGKRGRIPTEVVEKYRAREQQTIPAAAAQPEPAKAPVNSTPQPTKKPEQPPGNVKGQGGSKDKATTAA